MEPVRASVPLLGLVAFVLILPALGVAMVKPSVVGTTARALRGKCPLHRLLDLLHAGEYRRRGWSFNAASWAHRHLGVENVFRVSAASVLLMFFAVLLFFKEPRRSGGIANCDPGGHRQKISSPCEPIRDLCFSCLFFPVIGSCSGRQYIILPISVPGTLTRTRMLS